MNQVFSAVKRLFTLALAGMLALFAVACSSGAQAAMPGSREPNPPGQAQPYEGGMNNFNDVPTDRVNTKGAQAKAKALKDRVQRNIDEKRIDSTEQYVENYRSGTPLGERTARIGNDIRRGAENVADDVQDITTRGADRAGQNLENAKANTKAAGRDLANDAKATADRASNTLKSKANQAERALD